MLSPLLWKNTTALTCSASPAFISDGVSATSGTYGTSVTVTPSGGLAPYTYNWTEISTSGDGDLGATAGTSATTSFTWSGLSNLFYSQQSTFQCIVTDALSQTTFVNVSVFLIRTA